MNHQVGHPGRDHASEVEKFQYKFPCAVHGSTISINNLTFDHLDTPQ